MAYRINLEDILGIKNQFDDFIIHVPIISVLKFNVF
jgi:cellobiose phosphorylase